jgi:hypothetical protein
MAVVTTENVHQSRALIRLDESAIIRAALASFECPPKRCAAWVSQVLAA